MDSLGVIFDMDGVLVDTYRAHLQSWQLMAAELGRTVTEEQFGLTFGRTSRESVEMLLGDRFSEDQIARFDRRKEELFREIIARQVPVMPGAPELVAALDNADFLLAVGSSAPPANLELVLGKLSVGERFDAVVTGADVRLGKPDPQVFLLAAARLRVPPERCAVIEDAPLGIEAAHAAGAAAIGLASTGRTRESLRAADLVIDQLAQLSPERIESLIISRLESE